MAEPSRTQKIHDERLDWAWEQVKEAASAGSAKRYGTLARKLPRMLQGNGLGQTLAFLFSKRGKKERTGDWLLLVQLGARLAERERGAGRRGLARSDLDRDPAPLMTWLTQLDRDGYRRASHEARICAEWLKRFAEGQLEEEQT